MEQDATQTDSICLAKETLETCIFNLSSVSNSDSPSKLQLIGQTLKDLTRAEMLLLDLMLALTNNKIDDTPSKSTDQAEACEPCDEPVNGQTFDENDEMSTVKTEACEPCDKTVTGQTFDEKDEVSTDKTEACEPCDEPVASQTFNEKDEMSKDLGLIPSKEVTVKLKYEYKEDQWSPINRKGKKQYDRNFLLMLQNDPLSIERPPNLPLMEIIKDRSLPLMQNLSSYQPSVWLPGFIKNVSTRQRKKTSHGHDGIDNKHSILTPLKIIDVNIEKMKFQQSTDQAEACEPCDEPVTGQTFNKEDEMSTVKTEAREPCDEPVTGQTFDEKDEMSKDGGSISSEEVKSKLEYEFKKVSVAPNQQSIYQQYPNPGGPPDVAQHIHQESGYQQPHAPRVNFYPPRQEQNQGPHMNKMINSEPSGTKMQTMQSPQGHTGPLDAVCHNGSNSHIAQLVTGPPPINQPPFYTYFVSPAKAAAQFHMQRPQLNPQFPLLPNPGPQQQAQMFHHHQPYPISFNPAQHQVQMQLPQFILGFQNPQRVPPAQMAHQPIQQPPQQNEMLRPIPMPKPPNPNQQMTISTMVQQIVPLQTMPPPITQYQTYVPQTGLSKKSSSYERDKKSLMKPPPMTIDVNIESATEKARTCQDSNEPLSDDKVIMNEDQKLIPTKTKIDLEYEEGQWSPFNLNGKKWYNRKFLVSLQAAPLSMVKPPNMLNCAIVKDTPFPLVNIPSKLPKFFKKIRAKETHSQDLVTSENSSRDQSRPVRKNQTLEDSLKTAIGELDEVLLQSQQLKGTRGTKMNAEKKTRQILKMWLSTKDQEKSTEAICLKFHSGYMSRFVTTCINEGLKLSSEDRNCIGELLSDLIAGHVVLRKQFEEGLVPVLETATRHPSINFWNKLGELIAPMFLRSTLSINFVFSEGLKMEDGYTAKCLAGILKVIQKLNGEDCVKVLWKASHLNLKDFLSYGEILEFVDQNNLQYLFATGSLDEIPVELTRLLKANPKENEIIVNWIEENVGPMKTDYSFIRTLVMVVAENAITGTLLSGLSFDDIKLTSRKDLLKYYLGNKPDRQLQALYALQHLMEKLGHPPRILHQIFVNLYYNLVIDENNFFAWKASSDSLEQDGKDMAIKSTVKFFFF